MNKDNAIKYNAKLEEVKDNIEEIKKLNINANTFGTMISKIEKKVRTKVEECYKKFEGEESNTFLSSSLDIIYSDAIKELEKINNYLSSEYTSYFKIQATVNELKNRLENINYNEVDSLVLEAKDLIRSLGETNTINYEDEKNVVEDVYKIVYEILKIESIYGTSSELLETIYDDDVDSVYISKLIKEDVKRLKDDKDVSQLVKEINKNGFEGRNYINKDLIRLITYIDNPEYSDKKKASLIEKIKDYEEKENEENNKRYEIRNIERRVNELKKDNKALSKESRDNICGIVLWISIVCSSVIGINKLLDLLTVQYKTTTEEYDTETGEVKVEEEYMNVIPTVNLTKYSEWKYDTFFEDYSRSYTVYSFENPNFEENIEDYMKTDLEDLLKVKADVERAKELTEDMKYDGEKYVVTRITRDENDKDYPRKSPTGIFTTILLSLTTGFVSTLLAVQIIPGSKLSPKTIRRRRKDIKKTMSLVKQKLLDLKEKVLTVEELKEIREKLLEQYEKLPTAIKQDENIQEKVLVLKKDEEDE